MHNHTKSLLIEGVAPGSIAAEFELQAGDRLLAVNGHRLRDLIDYSYYTSSEQELLLEIARADGEIWELEVEREAGRTARADLRPNRTGPLPQQLHLLLRPPASPGACANRSTSRTRITASPSSTATTSPWPISPKSNWSGSSSSASPRSTSRSTPPIPNCASSCWASRAFRRSWNSCRTWPPPASPCTPRWCSARASMTAGTGADRD